MIEIIEIPVSLIVINLFACLAYYFAFNNFSLTHHHFQIPSIVSPKYILLKRRKEVTVMEVMERGKKKLWPPTLKIIFPLLLCENS